MPQNGHWKDENGQIGNDVEPREAEPEGREVDAATAFNTLVPVEGHW